MKTLFAIVFAAGTFAFAPAVSGQTGCSTCAQKAGDDAVSTRTVPGTNEAMLVGRIENLVPISVLAALGCEPCVAKAVAWALQQGSSTEDVERALRAIAAMQKLDCFKQQFGPEAADRLEKPLAAARKVLQQAIDQAAKQDRD